MKILILLVFLTCCHSSFGQGNGIGIFDKASDVGKPKNAGSSRYDESTQTYYMKGSGYNIWFNRDEFQYLYKKIGGDFILTANFEFMGEKGNAHRKIGWMIRESPDEAAASVNAVIHGDGLTVLQWRPLRGAYMRDPEDEVFYAKKAVFQTVQIERSGKKITMRVANWGEPLQDVTTQEMPFMKDSVLAGLYISSHDSDKSEEARIWNVRIDKPVSESYHPNPQVKLPQVSGVVGCRLETMDVFDGKRMVIRESAGRFEAPNWMPDGQRLLYNEAAHYTPFLSPEVHPKKLIPELPTTSTTTTAFLSTEKCWQSVIKLKVCRAAALQYLSFLLQEESLNKLPPKHPRTGTDGRQMERK